MGGYREAANQHPHPLLWRHCEIVLNQNLLKGYFSTNRRCSMKQQSFLDLIWMTGRSIKNKDSLQTDGTLMHLGYRDAVARRVLWSDFLCFCFEESIDLNNQFLCPS